MTNGFANRAARVLVVDESGSGRQLISDVVRAAGFRDVIVAASGGDAVRVLECESIDWMLTTFLGRQPVNALHLLQLTAAQPDLRHLRTSVIFEADDEPLLDAAFALGAMSCHPKTAMRSDMTAEIAGLLETIKSCGGRTTLAAATYLRRRLRAGKRYQTLVALEKSLLELHPGSPALLLSLGEAQLLNGETDAGVYTIRQAGIIDERAKTEGAAVMQRILNRHITTAPEPSSPGNSLGLQTCIVVDPDSAVLGSIHSLLVSVGIPRIETFDDGEAAWRWLEANPEPCLILQEWRLPGLAGPLLLQRIRQHGFIQVPVVVTSSVIKPNELPLLREMGVDSVVPKPFGQQLFFKTVIWTVQQNQAPTEQKSLERKIRRHLEAGQMAEAERLRLLYMADQRFSTAAKKHMEAEFALAGGSYRLARDLAIEALKLSGDSLLLLNLIGKALLKLGDYEAAHKFFEKANALSPMNVEHLCNMAVSRFEAGKRDEAQFLLQKAAELDPGNAATSELTCEHAIIEGEVERAKALLGQLQSVTRVVGYMNNRAVALTRCGRYEEGIKLYLQTMSALPGACSDTHDIVAYNLGLAYARYGELDKAESQLQPVIKRSVGPLAKRAVSLARRIKRAAAAGEALPIYAREAEDGEESGVGSDADAGVEIDLSAVLEMRRGDVCLCGVFDEPRGPEIQKLLATPPRYRSRKFSDRGPSPERQAARG